MPFLTRQRLSRAFLPALLATFVLAPLISGCGEDRSNLIPGDTADSLIAKFDEVQALAASGQCFAAAKVALEAQQEIESMSTEVDSELKRSLVDGVTELQVLVNDPDKCTESGTATDEPVEVEETPTEPEGTTGDTGTTDSGATTTGGQGTTNDEQDSDQPQNNGNGNGNQTPNNPPATNPNAPPANPNPSTPPSGPGSGGLGPG